MKVFLINPPLVKYVNKKIAPVVENLFYNSAPLGLCYLAAVLRQEGVEVEILDALVEGLKFSGVISRIKKFNPDIIGISSNTISFNSAAFLTRTVKKIFPNKIIIIGGPHITANPDDLLKHPEFDIGVIGEGEVTFKELIKAITQGVDIKRVKGLAYTSNGKVQFTEPREFIRDLDWLPFPARDLVPIYKYRPQPNDQKRLPKLSMISSRGCPYSCIFCDKNVFKNLYRSFSPQYIVKEMTHLVKNFKAKDIAFLDSTFTPNKTRVYQIVNEIKDANLDVTWTCSVRANVLDKELLKEMKNAGCWRIRIGVESGNGDVLKFIKKGISRYQVKKVANWAYELNLESKAFFMVGHLIDNKDTINDSISFAKSLPLKDITVQINTPMRRTKQYEIHNNYGKIVTYNKSNFSYFEPVFVPNSLTREELIKLHRKFYRTFYLRPVIFWRHISKIRKFHDIKKYLRAIKLLFNLCIEKL